MTLKMDALLSLLQKYTEPVSVAEIKQALNEPVAERTLRRWLNTLIQEGSVTTVGQYRSRRYQLTQSVSSPGHSAIFSEHSVSVIQKVLRPIFERKPCTYSEAWLKQYIPNETFYLTQSERESLAKKGLLLPEETAGNTYTRKIFNRLLIDLSYNSSRLEGNTYSLLETQQLIFEGRAAEDKLDVEKLMILNHKEAIQFLVEGIGRLNMDVDSVRTLHYLLADGLVLANDAGQLRSEPVRISLSTYIPLEGQKRLLGILQQIIKKASEIKDLFEQSFFLLVHISYLQPFVDVNKRTARLCANIPLVKHHLIPLSFNDVVKDDYISAVLAVYEYNDIRPLADLYVWSYLRTCQQYQVLSEAIGIDIIHIRYRPLQRKFIAEMIQNVIVGKAIRETLYRFSQEHIPAEDRQAFIDNTEYQIEHLEKYKITGMGISLEEFLLWKQKMG